MNIIVITGASSGLGREFALQLNKMHYVADEVWLIARRSDRLEALSKELSYPCERLTIDLSKEEDLNQYKKLLEKNPPKLSKTGIKNMNRVHAIDTDKKIMYIFLFNYFLPKQKMHTCRKDKK